MRSVFCWHYELYLFLDVDLRVLLDRVTDEGEACISRMLEALARFKRDSEVQKRVTEQQHRAKLCAAGPQSLC